MDKPNTKKIGYCSSMPSLPKQGKFIGCDGKAWSDDFVKWHLQKAVDEENYEWAQECKSELLRRGIWWCNKRKAFIKMIYEAK